MKMKLDKELRAIYKDMKKEFKAQGGLFQVNDYGDTFAIIPQGRNTAKVSVALLNPADEYNKKYGRYIALERMIEGFDNILMRYNGDTVEAV